MDKMYGDMSHFLPKDKQEKKHKRITPEEYKEHKRKVILGRAAENFPSHAKQIKKALEGKKK